MSWLYWDVAILNIPLSMRTNDDDWAWHYERSGFFSVRLAYHLLVGMKVKCEDWLEGRAAQSDTQSTRKDGKSLWKIRVPGKIKNFAWRLAKNSIPIELV